MASLWTRGNGRTTDIDRDETHLVHRHEMHVINGGETYTVPNPDFS